MALTKGTLPILSLLFLISNSPNKVLGLRCLRCSPEDNGCDPNTAQMIDCDEMYGSTNQVETFAHCMKIEQTGEIGSLRARLQYHFVKK